MLWCLSAWLGESEKVKLPFCCGLLTGSGNMALPAFVAICMVAKRFQCMDSMDRCTP